ncbi:MAG: thymidine phosphorylase [Armatimonadota bacterium]
MRVYDLILKKRNGEALSTEEMEFLVGGYAEGRVPDYQVAALLMAVWFRGMDARETADLTASMVRSGETLDLSCLPGVKVDKHSTGGVGDKATLVLAPLLAAAGVPVVKMSGRSLGHTGGTLDKLESIPGMSCALSPERMVEQVQRIGLAIGGQTAELVPADKKLYALRDLTATIDCVPLIAASVMSKKIASGADAIVLDVKAGSGAFMRSVPEAVELARAMVEIGRQVGRRTVAAVTDMNQPLGCAVGNALEVEEAIMTLRGEGPSDLVELCVVLGGLALRLAGKGGEEEIRRLLADGSALVKFREMVEAQGGDPRVVEDTSILPKARKVVPVPSPESGFVTRADAMQIARAAVAVGACRGEAGVSPDLSAGIVLKKKVGDKVSEGETLAEIHTNAAVPEELVLSAFALGDATTTPILIYEILE